MRDNSDLYDIVAKLLAPGKGILAADESVKSANTKRLEVVGIEGTDANRRMFRQILFTAPGIEEYLSGIIMFEGSLLSETDDGIPFVDLLVARGIIPGVKVDKGMVPLEGFDHETVTQGLDGLAERLDEYYKLGCRFAKWRAAFNVGDSFPTDVGIKANAVMFARYAAMCQAAGIVPIIEPEVLYDGDHDLPRAREVTMRAIQITMNTLSEYRVDFKGIILKSSMVLAGKKSGIKSTSQEVADATLRTFHLSVPHEVPGIVFLSGGQDAEYATENLNQIAQYGKQPWAITYSYSRAIQMPMLETWAGKNENIPAAQAALLERCKANSEASSGTYKASAQNE